MDQIQWEETDSVGVPSIDEQHKKLVEITNTLFTAILNDEGERVVGDMLDELADYVEYHFAYEEQVLVENEYPADKLQVHINEHQQLKRQVHSYIAKLKEDMTTLDLDVFDFLRDWATRHMLNTDDEYADFLRVRGVR